MSTKKLFGQSVPKAPWGDDLGKYPAEVSYRVYAGARRGTKLNAALRVWEEGLIADLGGRESLTVGHLELVTLAGRAKLMLDSIDRWLLNQPTLILAKRKSLIPAIAQRASLAASLVDLLKSIGLEKKAPPIQTIAEIMAEKGHA